MRENSDIFSCAATPRDHLGLTQLYTLVGEGPVYSLLSPTPSKRTMRGGGGGHDVPASELVAELQQHSVGTSTSVQLPGVGREGHTRCLGQLMTRDKRGHSASLPTFLLLTFYLLASLHNTMALLRQFINLNHSLSIYREESKSNCIKI